MITSTTLRAFALGMFCCWLMLACAIVMQDKDGQTIAASVGTDAHPTLIHHPTTGPDVEFTRPPVDPASAEAKRLDKLMLLGIIAAAAGIAMWIGRATYPPLKLMPSYAPYGVAGLGAGLIAWSTIGQNARIWIFIIGVGGLGFFIVKSWLHNHKLKNHDADETFSHGWFKQEKESPKDVPRTDGP